MNLSKKTEEAIKKIKRDRKHGASQLARMAAQVFIDDGGDCKSSVEEYLLRRKEIGKRLIEARPSMSSIYNVVNELLSVTGGDKESQSCTHMRDLTRQKAQDLIETSINATEQIAEAGMGLIEANYRVFLYSYSSTVISLLMKVHSENRSVSAIVPLSGPGQSGKDTARELSSAGIEVTLISDSAIGQYIQAANLALCGADRVTYDGNTVNATGTSLVAMAARFCGTPFYIACERLKFDPRQGYEPDLEPGKEREIAGPDEFLPLVTVKNYAFDITPSTLIEKYITETGIMSPEEVVSCMSNHQVFSGEDKPG